MPYLIHHALDRSADRNPDATAFRFEDEELSYAQCVTRTNQLARTLVEQGVRRGDRVGIFLHKSLESAIAIYGIMKAGAAYVPIDPRLSAESVAHIVRECGCRHIVSADSKLSVLEKAVSSESVDAVIGVSVTDNDSCFHQVSWQSVSEMPGDDPTAVPALSENDLAYVMYTSGSTGKPKGIMHTHRSGLSYAKMAAKVYGIDAKDILSNHSPLHFDMSTFDYFSGPLSGATTVIVPEEYMMLPASLSELIQDERITIWYSVTTALVDLLLRGDLDNRDLTCLRWVNFGGESFPPTHLKNLMHKLPGARFSNVYGPAEVNQCTFFHVPPTPNQYDDHFVPIGRAWEIASSLVLDANDNVVTPGEPGELLIASSTRMQGYWNDQERTDAGFYHHHPRPESSDEDIYFRTGDIVREDEEGEFHFLGRSDRQIKIRGFRVELDGIEAALTAHDAVAEAAVWVGGDEDLPSIQAAVLLKFDRCGTTRVADLAEHARRRLPHYAVPEEISIHESLPRTGSGKIDRRAIRAMAANRMDAGSICT